MTQTGEATTKGAKGKTRPVKAATTPLSVWRAILFWPLALCEGGFKVSDPAWREIGDRLDHLPPADASQENHPYAEFVYFHEYVQTALFGAAGDCADGRSLRVFARDDITGVKVQIKDDLGPRTITLKVDRLRLYQPSPGIVILVTEVSADRSPRVDDGADDRPMTLADALTLGDEFRRAYPGFFDRDGIPGLSPLSVEWQGSTHGPGRAITPCAALAHVKARRTPPVFDHWLQLLPTGMVVAEDQGRRLADGWRQLVDERMASMTFISFTESTVVAHLDDGLKARLAAVDSYATFRPYSDAQIGRDLRIQTYDRFSHFGTLYFVSGYGFTAVGSGEIFEGFVQTHFRRHYFQMGLLLQVEAATCLALSNRVSRAVAMAKATPARTLEALREAQKALLDLTHRYRFTGVSNHVQARELFSLWRRMLGNDALYQDLKDELAAGGDFQRAEKQDQDSRVATRFTVMGVSFGLLGLANLVQAPVDTGAATIVMASSVRHWLVCAALVLGAGASVSLILEFFSWRWLDRFKVRLWGPVVSAAVVFLLALCWIPRIFGP